MAWRAGPVAASSAGRATHTERAHVQMRAEGGRRHLGSYLPPEELQKFLQKAEAVTSGSYQPPTPQAAGPAIDQSNLGFRMLQNAGWSAGQGLGAASSGVQAPIAAIGVGSQVCCSMPPLLLVGPWSIVVAQGLGHVNESDIQEGDDVFEQYRCVALSGRLARLCRGSGMAPRCGFARVCSARRADRRWPTRTQYSQIPTTAGGFMWIAD